MYIGCTWGVCASCGDTCYSCVDGDDKFVELCARYVGGAVTNLNLQRQLVNIILGRGGEAATVKPEGAAAGTAKPEEGAAAAAVMLEEDTAATTVKPEGAAAGTAKPEDDASAATVEPEEGIFGCPSVCPPAATAKPEENASATTAVLDDEDSDDGKLSPELTMLKEVITTIWESNGENWDVYTSRYTLPTPHVHPAYTPRTPCLHPVYTLSVPQVSHWENVTQGEHGSRQSQKFLLPRRGSITFFFQSSRRKNEIQSLSPQMDQG